MKDSEKLFEAIGDIRDDQIEDAEPHRLSLLLTLFAVLSCSKEQGMTGCSDGIKLHSALTPDAHPILRLHQGEGLQTHLGIEPHMAHPLGRAAPTASTQDLFRLTT